MEQVWFVAALWLLLSLVAGLIAHSLKISTALSEIVVVAQLADWTISRRRSLRCEGSLDHISCWNRCDRPDVPAGAELDPDVFRAKWKESTAVGLVGFFGPFRGAALVTHYVLGWSWRQAGLLAQPFRRPRQPWSTQSCWSSVSIRPCTAKAILAACFINDLGTVLALGSMFSPFTTKNLS